MPEPEPSPADRLKDELARLAADLKAMIALRAQLARLELDAAWSQLRRLVMGLLLATILLTVGLAAAAVALAELVECTLPWTRPAWLATFATALVAGGLLVAGLVWHRFRRRFTGFQETLEELREDAAWVQEWLEGKDAG